MDFGLDLEPPAGPVNGLGAGLTPLPDPLKDVDLAHFDLDEPVAPAAATVAAAEPSIDSLFDDAQTPATLPEAIPPAQEFDLSGIDLDLNDGKTASVGVDDPLSAIHMEMDTKLDLAIAYQEIGDKEGARELIDEVIKGGSEEQVAKANTMKAQFHFRAQLAQGQLGQVTRVAVLGFPHLEIAVVGLGGLDIADPLGVVGIIRR